MIKIPINGKHGAVFDDSDLRELIIDSINSKQPREAKIEIIKNAVSDPKEQLQYLKKNAILQEELSLSQEESSLSLGR